MRYNARPAIRRRTLPITVSDPSTPGPVPETGIASPETSVEVLFVTGALVGAAAAEQEHPDSAGQLEFLHLLIPFTDEQLNPDSQLLSVLQDASHFPGSAGALVGATVGSVVAVGSGVLVAGSFAPTPPPDPQPVDPQFLSKQRFPQS
jgi:hypothetical protein